MPTASRAGVSIEQIAFHKATASTNFVESGTPDTGGVVFVVVRNTGGAPETITNATFAGILLDNVPGASYWRVEPNATIPAGSVGVLLCKGTNSTVAENTSLQVRVMALSGAQDTQSETLTTPKLRIGSVIPSQDLRTLHIFLKNLDSASLTVTQVFLNDDVTAQCTFVGGPTISPSSVGIVKVAFPQPQVPMSHYAVRVISSRAGGGTATVAAPVRLIEPWLPGGSYQDAFFNYDDRMQSSRRWMLDSPLPLGRGSGAAAMEESDRYHLRQFNWRMGTRGITILMTSNCSTRQTLFAAGL
jgi:hypothetical protein